MAKTYIKLGPIGDAFSSKELGLFLNENNAAEIDEAILNNRLVNFLLTGFLVEISKLEYDNIKLNTLITNSNIPNNTNQISQPYILEPVEDVLNSPTDSSIGKRYLVPGSVPGIWLARKDFIAQSNGEDWDYIRPEDGMILPVYEWGISLHYTGTYPSGHWDIPDDRLEKINQAQADADSLDFKAYADAIVGAEASIRNQTDINLQTQITNIIKSIQNNGPFSVLAEDVSVKDINNYYVTSNVESILKELGLFKTNTNSSLTTISQLIHNLFIDGYAFSFLDDFIDPTPDDGTLGSVFLNRNTRTLFKKKGTTNENAIWSAIIQIPGELLEPLVEDMPAGTPVPIVIDFQSVPYSAYGKNPTITFEEKVSDTVSKPRADIYYEKTWDAADHETLLSISITPYSEDPGDGTPVTTENLTYKITQ